MEDEEPLTPDVKNVVNFFNSLNKTEQNKPKPKPKPNVKKINFQQQTGFKGKLSDELKIKAKAFNQNFSSITKMNQKSDELQLIEENDKPNHIANFTCRTAYKQPDIVLEVNKLSRSEYKSDTRLGIKPNESDGLTLFKSKLIADNKNMVPTISSKVNMGDFVQNINQKEQFSINENVRQNFCNNGWKRNNACMVSNGASIKITESLQCEKTQELFIKQSKNNRKTNLKLNINETKKIQNETNSESKISDDPKFGNIHHMLETINLKQNLIQKSKSFDEFNEKNENMRCCFEKNGSAENLDSSANTKNVVCDRFVASFNILKKHLDVNGKNDKVRAKKNVKRKNSATVVEPYDTYVIKSDSFKNGVVIESAPSPSIVRKTSSKKKGIYRRIRLRVGDEDGNIRSDAFLEPYLQGLGDRQSPGVGAPSPSPPPACRIAPFLLPTSASRSPSRESLISSNGGSDAGSEDSGDTGYGAACDISLVERLIRSHPIWFLPGIQRAGAFHLLQGKEEGCFVVRQSSQPDTMALSVRLPPDKGPYIEHYLIQSSGGRLGLETSENRFDNMPALIAHYANCCDELPVQLTLPKAIREAHSRQQLSSLALLGQEFWRYSPPPSASCSPDVDLVLNLNPLMSTFKTAEPSTPVTKDPKPARPNTLNLINNVDQKSDQKIEPIKCIPSFKNEQVTKTPPPPPPRWSKPTTPQNNFTVTTTVTFSVNSQSPRNEQPLNEIICDPKRMSPEGQTSTMSSKGSLRRGPEQIISPNSSVLSPNSDPNSLMSPDTLSPLSVTKTTRHSRRTKHKVSKHYQESDILESPTVYYRSAVGDKISDYEDLWSNDHSNQRIKSANGGNLASPDLLQHTGTVVSLNNNVLSPTDSHTGSQNSHCSTPLENNFQSPSELSTAASQESTNSPKQSSPFYAEPADSLAQTAVPRRLFNRNLVPVQQRHSNPAVLHSQSPLSPGLERVESSDFNGTISSSVDNLSPKQRIVGIKKPEVKAVLPPSVKPRANDTWQIDNSWKFMGNEADMSIDSSDPDYDSDWPATIPNVHLSAFAPDPDDRISIQEMISQRFPDIRMSADTTDDEMCRMSAYDNVDDRRVPRAPPSEISELTEFSEPWAEITHTVSNNEADDCFSDNFNHPPSKVASISRSKSFKDRLDPLLSAPRLKALRSRDHGDSRAVGAAIRNYALELAKDKSTTFAQNIDNFIACTRESREVNPQIVMRNMRQFMSGMKNYLVKHGEKGFDKEVERERNKLKSTEFLNLDAILEGVLHCLVVTPLKNHLQNLFVNHYTKTGAIRLLHDNIQYASTRPSSELAIKPKVTLPNEAALQTISQYLTRLQTADSPLEKLEFLLAAIATIFNSVKTNQLTGSGRNIALGADDFLPLFVWVLVKTNFIAAEIEAEYMWGLLHPSLLSGEGGYYLTTLSSAVHVLKNFKDSNEENVKNNVKSDSVLKVVVPDELHGSILTKTLPARPHMTTKEVCKIIAHKAKITNPQDFALYRLVDGEETMLGDNECPQDFMSEGKHVMLAYKRIDAKIAWPKQQSNC